MYMQHIYDLDRGTESTEQLSYAIYSIGDLR